MKILINCERSWLKLPKLCWRSEKVVVFAYIRLVSVSQGNEKHKNGVTNTGRSTTRRITVVTNQCLIAKQSCSSALKMFVLASARHYIKSVSWKYQLQTKESLEASDFSELFSDGNLLDYNNAQGFEKLGRKYCCSSVMKYQNFVTYTLSRKTQLVPNSKFLWFCEFSRFEFSEFEFS